MAATTPARGKGIVDRLTEALDERLGLSELRYEVPRHANSIFYTLGGVTFVGILVLVATGVYLAQYYHPHPTEARASVAFIIQDVRLGDFFRSVHFWMANLVIITALLHLVRVFATGAYKAPREVNWLAGVGLLALLIAFMFTGTVLKWDQEGYEALQHNEEIAKLLGGAGAWFTSEFSPSVPILTRLYFAHVGILPALLTVLLVAHFFLVKHHGISSLPGHEEERPAGSTDTQEAIRREGAAPFTAHLLRMLGFGLLLLVVAGALALTLPPALGAEIEPGLEVTKPPWMFYWQYAFENWWGIAALLWASVGAFVILAFLPWVDRAPSRRRSSLWWALARVALLLAALLALSIYTAVAPAGQHIG